MNKANHGFKNCRAKTSNNAYHEGEKHHPSEANADFILTAFCVLCFSCHYYYSLLGKVVDSNFCEIKMPVFLKAKAMPNAIYFANA